MARLTFSLRANLTRAGGKSSLAALIAALALWLAVPPVAAHEVRPAVGDVTVGADTVRLDLRLTLEAMVSGIDLNGLDDTNESPLSGYYDQLRATPPEALEAAFRKAWPRIRDGLFIEAEGQRLTPEISDIHIPPVGDVALPRDSTVVVTATLPPGDGPVTAGWNAAFGPLVLRQMGEGDALYTGYLQGGQKSDPLPRQGVARLGALTEFGRYVVLGFEHIVPKGLDHILFVLGLFFFSLHLRPLLLQVTAFTLAHTVTLALATLKIVSVPAQIVEPLIAASIVYVAVENVLGVQMSLRRIAVVFGFGLLHGLGFASVLGEIGLNPARLIADLIGFNIGVEFGQLAVIAVAFLLVGAWFGHKPWYRARVAVPASVVIALVGAWWFVQRTIL
ncbi:HupE/UreJ family protein [Actibacterium sp. D379-3]